ncbi:LamG domain-containing protein [Candidatus Poribacteria bacterium]
MKVERLLIGMAILFVVSSILVCSGYAEVVGMWLFDEGQGDTAENSSGNGHDGTLVNGPEWVQGKFGKALEFDGTNGVQVPHTDELSLETFTIMAWINVKKGGVWQQIVAKQNSPRNYTLGISPADLIECAFTVGGNFNTALGKTPVADAQWHHVTGTYDGDSIRVYIDGVLEGESPSIVIPDVNTSPLEFGSGAGEPIVGGVIDEVFISNTALTEDEIGGLMGGIVAVEPTGRLATAWGKVKVTH